jgi:hypothetical protein
MLSSIKSALPDAVKTVPAAAVAQITRPGHTSAAAGYADNANIEEDAVKPPPLARPVAIAVATASRLVATSSNDNTKASEAWLAAILDYLQLDVDFLPPLALDETSAANDDTALRLAPFLTQAVSMEERPQVVHALLYASIFPPTTTDDSTSKSTPNELAYTAPARARVLASLAALGLSRAEAGVLLVEQERVVADELYTFLREGAERAKVVEEEVERNRRERENGWGGKWGRWMATGAGVVVRSILYSFFFLGLVSPLTPKYCSSSARRGCSGPHRWPRCARHTRALTIDSWPSHSSDGALTARRAFRNPRRGAYRQAREQAMGRGWRVRVC